MFNKLYATGNSFIKYVENFDVACLIETFMEENTIPNDTFPLHDTYFSPAMKLSAQGRCSGGVIVLVKKTMSHTFDITEITHNFNNIIALQFINKLSNKTYIMISAYIPPYTSPFYDNVPYDNGIHMLDEFIFTIQVSRPGCEYILCGDLNARTSNVQPMVESEVASKYLRDTGYPSCSHDRVGTTNDRQSEDTIVNGYGRKLIEMCASYDFVILNGMCKGDPTGAFTFIAPQGNSVVDYFIVSDTILNDNINISVENRIESWHMPIVLSLILPCTHFMHSSTTVSQFDKFVWDNNNVDDFKEIINSEEVINNVETLTVLVNVDVHGCITSLCKILKDASQCMKKTITIRPGVSKQKSDWFDNDCYEFKKTVKASLRRYRNHRDDETAKATYVYNRKSYKTFLKQKRNADCFRKVTSLFNNLSKPNLFWRDIKSILSSFNCNNSIDIDTWYRYFISVFQVHRPDPPICNEPITPYINTDAEIESLNSSITEEEVLICITSLKQKKSPGPDQISNEMLTSAASRIAPFLFHAFQYLFHHGLFPLDWCKSIIVPIHKKGDANICDNYRPISLTSLLSKIFTTILNKRLIIFGNKFNIIPEEQAGFREGYSTIDHIYTLYAMIQKQFSNNRKLYVAFIDYRKCFDSINRNALFHILESNGIKGNMLSIIKSLYLNVLASVRNNGEYSEYFDCPVGLKQGCILSPTLFSIFMTELSRVINAEGKHGIQLLTCKAVIFHLLYADDIALVSDTPSGLQNQLNVLNAQSIRLGLEVNLNKTKIIVFRKGGHLSKHETWHLGGSPIEVVNSYCYLGIYFTTRMSFTSSTSPFVAKAKKACNDILRSLNILKCYNLSVFLKLFDAKVQPILSYGCELWGVHDITDIEGVHTYALKRFLTVSLHCSNTTIYGDTGRYPLSICHKIRSLKYWFRILKLPQNRINRQSYEMMHRLSEGGKHNWVSSVRELFCTNGFGVVWMFKGVGNEKHFLKLMKQRLCDCFMQGWVAKLSSSEHFQCYFNFKTCIQAESFLHVDTLGKRLQNVLIQFRMGVSAINGHRYKFSAIATQKSCPFCKSVNEDEYHIIYGCPVYEHIRNVMLEERFISRRNINNMYTLIAGNTIMFAKYLIAVFSVRKTLLEGERDRERVN